MEQGLVSAQDFKTRITSRIREDIGNIIPQEAIDKTIEEAKEDFLKELKNEVVKIQKAFFEEILKEKLTELKTTTYKEDLQISISDELSKLLKQSGFDAHSLVMHNAANMVIYKLVSELQSKGLVQNYYY